MGLRIAACVGWLGLIVAPVVFGACSAEVGSENPANGGGSGNAGGSAAGGSTNPAGTCTENLALANARIWRLTDTQYGNAVRQLFGVAAPAAIADVDGGHGEFTNFSELSMVGSKAA